MSTGGLTERTPRGYCVCLCVLNRFSHIYVVHNSCYANLPTLFKFRNIGNNVHGIYLHKSKLQIRHLMKSVLFSVVVVVVIVTSIVLSTPLGRGLLSNLLSSRGEKGKGVGAGFSSRSLNSHNWIALMTTGNKHKYSSCLVFRVHRVKISLPLSTYRRSAMQLRVASTA